MSVPSPAVVPERDPAERAGDRQRTADAWLRRLEARRAAGVDLVERRVLEQRCCERLELVPVLVQPSNRMAVRRAIDTVRAGSALGSSIPSSECPAP